MLSFAQLRYAIALLGLALILAATAIDATSIAQETVPAGEPRTLAEAAAQNEIGIIEHEGTQPLRYRVRKRNAKGDTTRETIETPQGAVARLIERDGAPLTAKEDAAERQRLQEVLAAPEEFVRHHTHDQATHDSVIQLVKLMPAAMLFSYAPGQPQPAKGSGGQSTARQVVLDFHPDPNFHPPTMISNFLTGIEGRIWIDPTSRRVTRAEARIIRPVNFAFGIVARIYPGGTVEFEQADAGAGHWVYSHLNQHLTIREMMLKTVPEDAEFTSSDLRLLPQPIDWQQAIRLLLAMPVPTR
jgi:hypothetical protein